MMRVAVMFEIIDHCAKNAIPKTVSKEDTKNKSSDCSTPQIKKSKVKLMVIKISWIIFFTIFTRVLDLENFLAALIRSEEHTSELQSRPHLVCRLLLEK